MCVCSGGGACQRAWGRGGGIVRSTFYMFGFICFEDVGVQGKKNLDFVCFESIRAHVILAKAIWIR